MPGRERVREIFLFLLFFQLIYRMTAAVFPEQNLIICEDVLGYDCHGLTKYSDILCVGIWISETVITTSLVWDIIKKGFVKSIFWGSFKINFLLSIIYEIWLFDYIYNNYATNFDWFFKIMIIPPVLAFFIYLIFQTFISYDVLPNNEQKSKDLIYYIHTSLVFNGIMMLQVLCTFIAVLSTGISKEGNLVYIVLFGLCEMWYRLDVIMKQQKLLKNRHMSYTIHKKESRRANRDGELITGLPQDR